MNFSNWTPAALLAGGCIALTPACTDLEEEPVGALSAETFGQTEAEFNAIVAGGYLDLFGLLGDHNSTWTLNEVSTDEILVPTRGADWFDGGTFVRLHTHTFEAGEGGLQNSWNDLFGGVATVNRLLEQLPQLNEELAPPFEAELRGLRAFYYWYLMDMWGNVPLITSFTGGEENPSTRPRAEIYDFLVAELEELIPLLPPEKRYARVTQDVARGILAKVYLGSNEYAGRDEVANAIPHLDAIIDGGQYALEPNYFDNFDVDNDNSGENMFVIPYDEVFTIPSANFNLAHMTLHYQSQVTFNATAQPWNGYAAVQEFYDSYQDEDLRKGQYGRQDVPGNFLAGPQYESDGVTPLIDAVNDGDPDGPEIVFTPEINELTPNAYRQAGARIFKYTYADGFTTELANDFPLLRYADILLMKAEALLRTGGDEEEALDLVNMVRSRAFGSDEFNFEEIDLDILFEERGREMFAEGYRRSDLIRFDKFKDPWFGKGVTDDDNLKLFPVPTQQLDVNPNLVQNPGY